MSSSDSTVVKVLTVCAVCRIEVPYDEAVVPEVTDQLTYLCGLDCLRAMARGRGHFPAVPRASAGLKSDALSPSALC
jgi:hypothetical protein